MLIRTWNEYYPAIWWSDNENVAVNNSSTSSIHFSDTIPPLDFDEERILDIFRKAGAISKFELVDQTGFSRSKINQHIKAHLKINISMTAK